MNGFLVFFICSSRTKRNETEGEKIAAGNRCARARPQVGRLTVACNNLSSALSIGAREPGLIIIIIVVVVGVS